MEGGAVRPANYTTGRGRKPVDYPVRWKALQVDISLGANVNGTSGEQVCAYQRVSSQRVSSQRVSSTNTTQCEDLRHADRH